MTLRALLLVLTSSCQTPAILTPPVGPGCNPNTEHQCADGSCCLEYSDCGGPQGNGDPVICPAGSCCWYGPDDPSAFGAAHDAGAMHQKPTRRPQN